MWLQLAVFWTFSSRKGSNSRTLLLTLPVRLHRHAYSSLGVHEVVAVYTGAVTGHMAVMSTYWGEISRDFTVRMGFRRKPFGTFRAESVMSKDCHGRLTEESGRFCQIL